MDDDEYQFERTFGWLLHDTQRLIRRSWERGLKTTGLELSEPQARVLAFLYRQEGGLTQTQLAQELGMEKAPLGRLLDRMEEGGYVERRNLPADRRARMVFITDLGMSQLPAMKKTTRAVFSRAFGGVAEAKVDVLLDVLEAMRANLSAGDTEPPETAAMRLKKSGKPRQA
ncbi:MAG: MarR family transcriptional regulator [Parvibaculum sp.]